MNNCLRLSWAKCVVETELAPWRKGKEGPASLKTDGFSLSDERVALTECRVDDSKSNLSPVKIFLWLGGRIQIVKSIWDELSAISSYPWRE